MSHQNSVMTVQGSEPGSLKMSAGFTVDQAYHIREVQLDQDLSAILPGWKKCNERFAHHTMFCDPEWLLERVKQKNANIRAYLLGTEQDLMGAAAFEFYTKRLIARLGYFKLANLPLKVCRLLGYTPNMPEEKSAYDLLFQQLLNFEFEAIYLECIRTDSFFWQYLRQSPLVKKHFLFYSDHGVRPHPYIRMNGSFEDYMRKFPSKTRNNFSRRIRHLREHGEVKLVRVTQESEIDSFVKAAAEISRKTYQFGALGLGIRDPHQLRKWLKWAAQRRWLRSYLLECGGLACAFQLSYQYNRTFLGVEVGYDPALSKLGVGIVQQLLALEDLFQENTPDFCDFGTYAEYKEIFANEAYLDAQIWLFRRRLSPLFKLSTFRVFRETSKAAGNVLDRLNFKSKAKRWLRK
jgi:hypothetical protein